MSSCRFLVFMLLGVYWALWICTWVSVINFGKLPVIATLNIYLLHSLSFTGILIKHANLFYLSHSLYILSFFLFLLPFFHFAFKFGEVWGSFCWYIFMCTDFFFSSAVFSLLMSQNETFFISFKVFLIFLLFWFFLEFLSFYLHYTSVLASCLLFPVQSLTSWLFKISRVMIPKFIPYLSLVLMFALHLQFFFFFYLLFIMSCNYFVESQVWYIR